MIGTRDGGSWPPDDGAPLSMGAAAFAWAVIWGGAIGWSALLPARLLVRDRVMTAGMLAGLFVIVLVIVLGAAAIVSMPPEK